MYNHAPPGYLCPFCAVVAGDDLYLRTAERTLTTPRQRLPYAQKLKIALDRPDFGE